MVLGMESRSATSKADILYFVYYLSSQSKDLKRLLAPFYLFIFTYLSIYLSTYLFIWGHGFILSYPVLLGFQGSLLV